MMIIKKQTGVIKKNPRKIMNNNSLSFIHFILPSKKIKHTRLILFILSEKSRRPHPHSNFPQTKDKQHPAEEREIREIPLRQCVKGLPRHTLGSWRHQHGGAETPTGHSPLPPRDEKKKSNNRRLRGNLKAGKSHQRLEGKGTVENERNDG